MSDGNSSRFTAATRFQVNVFPSANFGAAMNYKIYKSKLTVKTVRKLNRIYRHLVPEKSLPHYVDLLLSQWSCYATIHEQRRLEFGLFDNILGKIDHENFTKEQDAVVFWQGVEKLLPSCFQVITSIHADEADDKSVNVVLRVLQKLTRFQAPKDIQMRLIQQYG
jgi:hypothetical protein